MIEIMTYENFMKMNPIERCVYALDVARQAEEHGYPEVVAVWKELGTPQPGGWEESDDDGKGPWWYIYVEEGKTKIAIRGTEEYDDINAYMSRRRA